MSEHYEPFYGVWQPLFNTRPAVNVITASHSDQCQRHVIHREHVLKKCRDNASALLISAQILNADKGIINHDSPPNACQPSISIFLS